MPVVVPVKFAFASRDLWFDPQGLDIIEGDHAICSTERGTEIGLVTRDPFEVEESDLSAPLKSVLRIADESDLDRADGLARKGEAAMADFRRLVKQNDLDMKPVGVEYLFGGEKAVFYFAAEERVDFRQLVKDLSACLHTRVDMRQIGVRDETRLVGGFAHCGQELCCTRFGGQFEPVSIRMAKEQDLPLNSAKISGVCGRLMCCLRYEFEAYKDFKSRAPKKKAVIDTPLGKARIQEYDTPREQLVLRLENGKVFRVNLSDMTCSDAAKKKASEQNCACRPDCVTRDVLERIESPEITLALMELDREMGVDVGDGLDKADRIVTSGPTPRRRRQREEAAAAYENLGKSSRGSRKKKGQAAEPEASSASSGRKRRKRSAGAAPEPTQASRAASAAKGSAGQAPAQQQPSRRRRRHLSSEERDEAFRAAAKRDAAAKASSGEDQGQGRSRRRKHVSAAQKPDVPSVAEQLATGDVKVTRRRPGDGGGAKAARAKNADRPERGSVRDRSAEGAGAPADDQAPKKRRRRRSRKPRRDDEGGKGMRGDGGSPETPRNDA
ncbi:regulatory iron-sulfur-containing complex subunit RicT [Collinsella sp. An2]|uniref:regulatory iron-sulfur-containing complex subunit RicT n=1 Tax=Collinsella sp. An2 TaxID=1965585 RepID=UPI000B3AF257|nr:regulatory iron-sulfur-containing complex subunit RicT [Collinsella sp. An2]OUP09503.1 hypothetical protein B5F33_04895 [Collinsella sp. An2]